MPQLKYLVCKCVCNVVDGVVCGAVGGGVVVAGVVGGSANEDVEGGAGCKAKLPVNMSGHVNAMRLAPAEVPKLSPLQKVSYVTKRLQVGSKLVSSGEPAAL